MKLLESEAGEIMTEQEWKEWALTLYNKETMLEDHWERIKKIVGLVEVNSNEERKTRKPAMLHINNYYTEYTTFFDN